MTKKEIVFENPIDRKGHTIAHNIVLRDSELPEGEKLLYFLLRSYAYGGADNCYPGQERLARNLGISKRTIKRRIRGLEDRGLIVVKKRFNERGQQTSNTYYIRDFRKVYRDAEKVICEGDGAGVPPASGAGVSQLSPPGESAVSPEEVKGFKNKDLEELYRESLDCLNKKAGKNFQSTTPGTRELLKDLYNRGFRLQEIKEVISKKSIEWLGTEYEKYLRPRTLFSPANFENYLNEPWPGRAERAGRRSGRSRGNRGSGGSGGSGAGKSGGTCGSREGSRSPAVEEALRQLEDVDFLEKNGWN